MHVGLWASVGARRVRVWRELCLRGVGLSASSSLTPPLVSLSKVKRTGIERGEASVSALRALLPEAARIRVDLSADVAVLRHATQVFCVCRRGAL